MEHDEEEHLLTVAGPELQNIITLALETTMRREEISSLLWCNIELQDRKATLTDTKNTKHKIGRNSRTVPLSPQALEILTEIKKSQQETGNSRRPERVFSQSPSAITQAMRRACKSANITGLTFHDLRMKPSADFLKIPI